MASKLFCNFAPVVPGPRLPCPICKPVPTKSNARCNGEQWDCHLHPSHHGGVRISSVSRRSPIWILVLDNVCAKECRDECCRKEKCRDYGNDTHSNGLSLGLISEKCHLFRGLALKVLNNQFFAVRSYLF